MHCPTYGTSSTKGQKYCRTCGTNLSIISKAVRLSDAIGRSDRGALPRIKAAMDNISVDHVSSETAEGLKEITHEIECYLPSSTVRPRQRTLSPEQRRDKVLIDGFKLLLCGAGLMIILYIVGRVMVLDIPAEKAARIPFELGPMVRIAWLLGLIPVLSGGGQIIAIFFIRIPRSKDGELTPTAPATEPGKAPRTSPSGSVTERTTELLETLSSSESRPRIAQPLR